MVYLRDGQYDRVHFNVFIIKLKKKINQRVIQFNI